jgi:hypothetical protein
VPCNEWSELIRHYRSAAKAHGEIVSGLGDQPGVQFNATWQESEKARRTLDQARDALMYHEHVQDCQECQSGRGSDKSDGISKGLRELQRVFLLASAGGAQQQLCEASPTG